MIKTIFLSLVALILLLAVGVQAYRDFQEVPHPKFTGKLSEVIPSAVPGWKVRDHELGDTESLRKRSEELLNLDDFVYRSYDNGRIRFDVYIAYWMPGKMPVRLVNAHNPDRCWSQTGWTCTDSASEVERQAKGQDLLPAQWRTFVKEGYTNHVIFWHIVDGEAFSYGRHGNRPPITLVFQDMLRDGIGQEKEQFFVRVSSETPLDEIWDNPTFQQIMSELADLCLTDGAFSRENPAVAVAQ